MMLHYNMMRKYTLALLSTFNDIEIAYLSADGLTTLSKKIPIKFSSREKAVMFDEHTTEQLISGNTNVLPRASLVLSTIQKAETRSPNKNTKHNVNVSGDSLEYNYAPVAYEYTYELVFQCRGMNEASMIVEQIAPRFNPNYTIRINEVPNSSESTSVPISLLDIGIESEEYEDISTNIVTLSLGLSLKGNMYPPLQTTAKVKNLQIYNNIWPTDEFQRTSLLEWDVINSVVTPPPTLTVFDGLITPTITDILGTFVLGTSNVTVVYSDKDNKYDELIFVWNVVSGDATITTGADTVQLTVNSGTTVTISCLITDIHGNSSGTFTKIL